jgi:hypothetical protein
MARRKKTADLKQVAVTPDGRPVFANCYAFYETHGMPLSMLLSLLWDRMNAFPDWRDLVTSSVRAGRSLERTLVTVKAEVCDAGYPFDVRDGIIVGLDKLGEVLSRPVVR